MRVVNSYSVIRLFGYTKQPDNQITRQLSGFISERSEETKFLSGVKGFTLIELLLYMGLVAIFLTATIYFAWDIIFGNVKAGVHQEVQENLRFSSHKIQTEIRNADSINISESDFGVNLATNPGTKLSLLGATPYYQARLQVSQGILQIKRGAGDWISLTSHMLEVTNLTFTNLSEPTSENIHFTLTIRYRNPSGRSEWQKEETFETSVQLR